MGMKKERIDCLAVGQGKRRDGAFASGDQIDDMFREASAEAKAADAEKYAGQSSSASAGDPTEFGDPAAYPEECCDATEISDEDYERWEKGSEKGFWRTFIENR